MVVGLFLIFPVEQAGDFTIIDAGYGENQGEKSGFRDAGERIFRGVRERRFPLALRAIFEYDKRADRPKTNKCLHTRGVYGIMSAERTLYLRIPVSAFTAQIRTLKYTVGVWRIKPGRAVLR